MKKAPACCIAFLISMLAYPSVTMAVNQVFEKSSSRKPWGEQLLHYFSGSDLGFEKNYALVIGISQYKYFKKLPTLDDPVRMKDFLLKEEGFDYVHLLTEEDVTASEVDRLMQDDFRFRVGKNDRFLFYWSGHGYTVKVDDNDFGFLPTSEADTS